MRTDAGEGGEMVNGEKDLEVEKNTPGDIGNRIPLNGNGGEFYVCTKNLQIK